MPRLAVLFVLSAASSPCPDLNLIHYMLVNFVWGDGQNILIFVGEAHATGAAGVLFKSIIQGRLKTKVASFSKTTISFSDDLLCTYIFNQTAKSEAK